MRNFNVHIVCGKWYSVQENLLPNLITHDNRKIFIAQTQVLATNAQRGDAARRRRRTCRTFGDSSSLLFGSFHCAFNLIPTQTKKWKFQGLSAISGLWILVWKYQCNTSNWLDAIPQDHCRFKSIQLKSNASMIAVAPSHCSMICRVFYCILKTNLTKCGWNKFVMYIYLGVNVWHQIYRRYIILQANFVLNWSAFAKMFIYFLSICEIVHFVYVYVYEYWSRFNSIFPV